MKWKLGDETFFEIFIMEKATTKYRRFFVIHFLLLPMLLLLFLFSFLSLSVSLDFFFEYGFIAFSYF